jgi:hypothetical protein
VSGVVAAVACGGVLGAVVHLWIQPASLPVMGAVIGGILFFELPELIHNLLDDRGWHVRDVPALKRLRSLHPIARVSARLRRHDDNDPDTWAASHWHAERDRLLEEAMSQSLHARKTVTDPCNTER